MTASASTTKVALITGGGTGIGRAIASALHRDDHTVAILGRRPERLESSEGFHAYACDISDSAAVRETVAKLLSDLGRLDVLVNNAGVIRNGSLEDTTEEDIKYQVNVNVLGTIHMTKACLPSLKACKGSIINVSSTLAWLPILEHSIYTATKGAIEAFNRAMALELGPSGVRVNCISPALTRTDIYYADGMDKQGFDSHDGGVRGQVPARASWRARGRGGADRLSGLRTSWLDDRLRDPGRQRLQERGVQTTVATGGALLHRLDPLRLVRGWRDDLEELEVLGVLHQVVDDACRHVHAAARRHVDLAGALEEELGLSPEHVEHLERDVVAVVTEVLRARLGRRENAGLESAFRGPYEAQVADLEDAIRVEVLVLRAVGMADRDIGLAQVHVVLPSFESVILSSGGPFGGKVGGLFPQRFHPTPGSPNVGGWGAGRHAAALAPPLPRQHDQAAHSGRLRPANPLHRSEATPPHH